MASVPSGGMVPSADLTDHLICILQPFSSSLSSTLKLQAQKGTFLPDWRDGHHSGKALSKCILLQQEENRVQSLKGRMKKIEGRRPDLHQKDLEDFKQPGRFGFHSSQPRK